MARAKWNRWVTHFWICPGPPKRWARLIKQRKRVRKVKIWGTFGDVLRSWKTSTFSFLDESREKITFKSALNKWKSGAANCNFCQIFPCVRIALHFRCTHDIRNNLKTNSQFSVQTDHLRHVRIWDPKYIKITSLFTVFALYSPVTSFYGNL